MAEVVGGTGNIAGAAVLACQTGTTTNGDAALQNIGAANILRLDSNAVGTPIKISALLIGDDQANPPDPLRFGVTAPISLAGRTTDLTLTSAQYQNQTLEFSGTPGVGAAFNIVLPNIAGFAKIFDLSAVTQFTATISVKAGSSSVILPGPACWVWYDGTTMHAQPMSAGPRTSQASNTAGTTLTAAFQTIAAIVVSSDVGDNIVVHVGSCASGTIATLLSYQLLIDGTPAETNPDFTNISSSLGLSLYARTFYLASVSRGVHTISLQARNTGGGTVTTAGLNNSGPDKIVAIVSKV